MAASNPALPGCIGPARDSLEHPPQPHIRFPDMPGHRRHRHLLHQEQRHRLEGPREVFAQAFPRRQHPVDLPRCGFPPPRQAAADLAAVLEHIEVPPYQFLGVIVGRDRFFRADNLPVTLIGRLLDPQSYDSLHRFELAPHHFPLRSQPQQRMEKCFGCHAPIGASSLPRVTPKSPLPFAPYPLETA